MALKILSLCLSMIGSWEEENKFEQLYWHYKDLLHYCAMGKVHDVHRAEEAVNTAFLHVAKNMQMVDEAISPRTKRLLVTIVERTAINQYLVNLANGKNADGTETNSLFQAINYVIFTATPYANVLNEAFEESLFSSGV